MYLKAVTLQGFKTFAQRTHFAFDAGVTAVVGPNGSGKSNFADALRWVLGEQSLRSLRSRRTEDVLFAGGFGRPPAGMAEVSLTFDNSQRWIDVPYSEVTVGRRAHRSGENEYYLNRERVRLRDVSDLLGQISLGSDGFAIVGQGTVDAALSLRPEDRRGLIEQAAAIGHLYARLEDARARLAGAQQNLARVTDLIGEMTPRLRTLERQARLAREREGIQADFFRALIRWYAHLWSSPASHRCASVEDRERALADLESATRAKTAANEALHDARARRASVERELSVSTARLDALRTSAREIDHVAALDQDRRENLKQRLHEHESILEQSSRDVERERAARDDLALQRDALAKRLAELRTELSEAEKEAASWQTRRATLERAVHEAHVDLTRAEAQHAAAVARSRAAQERLSQVERSIADQTQKVSNLEVDARTADERVADAEAVFRETREALDRLDAERNAVVERLEQLQSDVSRGATQLAEVERDLHALRARYDAIEQVESSGAGYFAGVRAVLQAANGRATVHLEGIVGVVAKLLEVTADKELAIETALGGHLQDIVVNRWSDAEAAIAHLKKSGTGRATFLPLDTLRPARRSAPPTGPGLLGVASALVSIDPRFQVVSEFLLGQTLVVEDLVVARRLLRDCAPYWQIVTLEGDIARSSGVVTGGAPGQTRGTLARHRELRTGREAIAKREVERDEAARALAALRSEVASVSSRVSDLAGAVRHGEERVRQASNAVADARQRSERVAQALSMRREELQRALHQRDASLQAVDEIRLALVDTERRRTIAAQALESARRERESLEQEVSDRVEGLAAKRSEHDTLRERLGATESALAQTEARGRQLHLQLQERQARLAEVNRAIVELDQRSRHRGGEREALASEIAAVEGVVASLGSSQQDEIARERQVEVDFQRWDAAEREATERLRDAERRGDLATAELDGLRQQIYLEIGSLIEEALVEGELRALTPSGAAIAAPIEPLLEPERLRARLDTLRARLRNMPVGSEAVAEYEAARERAEFLNGQAGDLGRTITTLRDAIEETRASMKSRFDDTFAVVADGFTRHFVQLFGGGTARLLVDGDDETAGIEVIAQPPGKRAESLSMLSGGERALTAAALLFALIAANPPPFCVLDEVDAALDESNVGRFCDTLQELSARTQFIVITHNRRTMEAATTIYGLAVENRCESRLLAMQLPAG